MFKTLDLRHDDLNNFLFVSFFVVLSLSVDISLFPNRKKYFAHLFHEPGV